MCILQNRTHAILIHARMAGNAVTSTEHQLVLVNQGSPAINVKVGMNCLGSDVKKFGLVSVHKKPFRAEV